MKMSVEKKSWAIKFVEWVTSLPGYLAIFFIVPVMIVYVIAVIINKLKGDS
jgi:hypothetical protein